MAKVPYGIEILPKISIAWVGHTNVTDRRQTDGWTTTYSERELKIAARWRAQLASHGCSHSDRCWLQYPVTGAARSPDILASPAVTLSRVIVGRLNANLRLQRPQNSVCRFNDVLIDNTNVHRPSVTASGSIKLRQTYVFAAHFFIYATKSRLSVSRQHLHCYIYLSKFWFQSHQDDSLNQIHRQFLLVVLFHHPQMQRGNMLSVASVCL